MRSRGEPFEMSPVGPVAVRLAVDSNPDRGVRRALRPVAVLLVALACLVPSVSHAVTMRVSEAVVSKPGKRAKICISLETDGQEVAGTQNDFIWDGNCATLTAGSCKIAAPGKELSSGFPPGSSFLMRAFVLALDNIEPIRDGDLYCCNFISELTQTGFCPIRITDALGADTTGRAIQIAAEAGGIRFDDSAQIEDDSAGCQLVRGGSRGGASIISGLIVLAVLGLASRRR